MDQSGTARLQRCVRRWKQFALLVASTRVADEVERIFMLDPDTKNMRIAKTFLSNLLAACGTVSDEDYASFLTSFLPPIEIADAVADSRQYQNQVAAHIQSLLAKLSE
jgi:hypothetical protein